LTKLLVLAALIVVSASLVACAVAPHTAHAPQVQPSPQGQTQETRDVLFATLSALDACVFDAFNTCATSGKLQKHASYFATDVEFYHDTGGVTWNRNEMLANTEKYVCGNFRRELIPGSLRVHPIKDFGAMAQGAHRFCPIKSGTCEGAAEFLIVWRKRGNAWQITRVFSYGHRPAM
jgi:Domain of unknown function (DUF4440)